MARMTRDATFAFLEGALDRAEHLRDDPVALAALWTNGRALIVDDDGQAWADAEGALHVPEPSASGPVDDAVFLGMRGEQGWFALRGGPVAERADGSGALTRVDLRTAAATWPAFEATAFAQARAVLHWRARHRYCGACGGELAYLRAGWLGRCPQCALEHYPRTDPAVIVAVSDGGRLLLGRQASWPPRRYSVLAGFVEPGESLEQTVVREVFEESGVRVLRSRYLASQPWPFPSSLMLGFAADAEPDVPATGDELEDARWFTHDEIGVALRGESGPEGLLLSPSISISRWLVERWYDGGR